MCIFKLLPLSKAHLKTVQDFLIKLGIKLLMHLLEICTFSLNIVIDKLTKIMNRADKNWAHFQKTKYRVRKSFREFYGKSSSRPHDDAPPLSFRIQIALDPSFHMPTLKVGVASSGGRDDDLP